MTEVCWNGKIRRLYSLCPTRGVHTTGATFRVASYTSRLVHFVGEFPACAVVLVTEKCRDRDIYIGEERAKSRR